MGERTPTAEDPLVAAEDGATSWARANDRLGTPERDRTYWLATVRPDGRPHVMPILGLWQDGAFHFITGEGTRKGRNLVGNPYAVFEVTPTTVYGLPGIAGTDEGSSEGSEGTFTPTPWRF